MKLYLNLLFNKTIKIPNPIKKINVNLYLSKVLI